ncbi:G2/mitotic-specific cyclin S13-7 isoform X1 [Cryptomeria japonica]|uniref:G2/mitotic-specific cyclin S13-7 isoform X1 n=1 Tax=Cryptomeria japonica TaxID=3369 RepID=UPI0027DA259C|nr:G2/mitotic-specific cyclin S13-7 isoform X1 [Cryptomeria japonica]
MARPRNSADGEKMGRGRGRGRAIATQGGGRGRALAIQQGNPPQQRNPRRPLRDIGNITGHITSGSNAPKNESVSGTQPSPTQNPTPAECPVTREFDETLASNQHLIQGDGEHDENGNSRMYNEVHKSTEPMEVYPEPMQVCPELIQASGKTNEIMTRSQTTLLREENRSLARKDETLVPDIDEADADDPMCIRDYVQDIYSFYRQTEVMSSVQGDYLSRQFEVTVSMRRILVDWIIEMHQKFDLRHETLFLTVNIIDRYLSRQSVPTSDLQLLGATAMLLACKYEEVSVPSLEDFVAMSGSINANNEILKMEISILTALEFSLTVPTPYVFLSMFLQAAGSDDKLEAAACFLIELALVEYEMVMYSPSMLAAAALYTARCTLGIHPFWNPTLEFHTNCTEANLKECAKIIVGLHENSNINSQINSVHRKYMSPSFSQVATLSPALFIRNT